MNPTQSAPKTVYRRLEPIPEETPRQPKILAPIAKKLVQYRNVESMLEERLEEDARPETVILVEVTYRVVVRNAQENKEEGKK